MARNQQQQPQQQDRSPARREPAGSEVRSRPLPTGGSSYLSSWPQRSPFGLLHQINADMTRLFDDFMGGRAWGSLGVAAWMPEIEMNQREGRMHVCVDLPGLSKEDISVEVDEGRLTLQGERRQWSQQGEADAPYYRTERSYGSFYRVVPLPDNVDVDSVQATFRDGVLDISFASDDPRQRGRRVEIEDGPPTQRLSGRSSNDT